MKMFKSDAAQITLRSGKLLFAIFLAMLSLGVHAAETIKIGVSCPLTGGSSDMGISMRNGIRLAADELNEWVGGINGKRIELVERDDLANNSTGKKIAEELVKKEKVSATIGICNAGVGQASIDTYQNAKVPLIIAVSTGTPLAMKFAEYPKDFYIFRASPRDEIQAAFIVAETIKRGYRKIALFADMSADGNSGEDSIQKLLAVQGIQPVSIQRIPVGASDLSDQVAESKAAGSDVIIIWAVGPEAAVLAKSVAKQKWPVQIIGNWPLTWRNFIDPSGEAAEGALAAVSFIQQASFQRRNSFILAYQQKFNTPIIPAPMAAAQGYDAMTILSYAIQQAQSDDPVKIKAALENLQRPVPGVITTYDNPFSSTDHDALSSNMLVLGAVHKGQIDYAYREDASKAFLMQNKKK